MMFIVSIVARKMEMAICFGSVPFLLHVGELPEFASLTLAWLAAWSQLR